MRTESLQIFDQIAGSERTSRRLKTLLKDPHEFGSQDWFMSVPPGFYDALDIKWDKSLGWTQGGLFSFKQGDVLHDSRKAYESWFSDLTLTIQVTSASPVSQGSSGDRFEGNVEFEIFCPDKARVRVERLGSYRMSQVDFVRFIISGPDEQLSLRISELKKVKN